MTRGHGRALGPAYRRIWTASTVSNLGDGVRLVAMPLLAARLTHDPRLISLVSVAGSLPWLLLGLLSGALVDRWDRRRILWVVDAVRAVVMGALTVAVVLAWSSTALLALVAFLLAAAETLFDTAASRSSPTWSATTTWSAPTPACTRGRRSPASSSACRSAASCSPLRRSRHSPSTPRRSPSPWR